MSTARFWNNIHQVRSICYFQWILHEIGSFCPPQSDTTPVECIILESKSEMFKWSIVYRTSGFFACIYLCSLDWYMWSWASDFTPKNTIQLDVTLYKYINTFSVQVIKFLPFSLLKTVSSRLERNWRKLRIQSSY